MWFVIISMILVVVILFFNSKKRMEDGIAAEGGMRKKYALLIEYIMSGDSRTKILDEGRSHLIVGLSVLGSVTTFELVNTFKTITVVCRVESVIFGNQKLDWEFPTDMNQEQMYFRINKDMESFIKKKFNVTLNE